MDTYLKPFFLEQKTSLYKQPYSDSQITWDFSILMVAKTRVPAPLVLSTVICQVFSVFSSSLYIYSITCINLPVSPKITFPQAKGSQVLVIHRFDCIIRKLSLACACVSASCQVSTNRHVNLVTISRELTDGLLVSSLLGPLLHCRIRKLKFAKQGGHDHFTLKWNDFFMYVFYFGKKK